MNAQALKTVLIEELSATEDGDAILVPTDRKVTVIAHLSEQLVAVSRVRSVRIKPGFINIVGDAEELFVDANCEFIVKSEVARGQADARPGFH